MPDEADFLQTNPAPENFVDPCYDFLGRRCTFRLGMRNHVGDRSLPPQFVGSRDHSTGMNGRMRSDDLFDLYARNSPTCDLYDVVGTPKHVDFH
ncbi:hypothetical protein CD178_02998 [Komagataeibacter saccharivorans]|uniref:Uncharacterized protein n=1 Tax=Komagataeibacter saccharivorans TaxID=265959 RepID=A0A347WFU9_9PROT|nr:hypothetical protein CD178_02998 [Komagataeibacter saccharivorans]